MGLENFLTDRITEEDTYNYTLPNILQMRAIETPDETAYIFLRDGEDDEERITYAELDKAANLIAHRLLAMNMKGERALMLFPPGLEFVKSLFGCFYAGVIAVPAYPPRKNRSLERIKILVVDSGSRVVISTADISQATERSFADLEELQSMQWLVTDDLKTNLLPEARPLPPLPNDIALLQYTSGSTGTPKGVMVTHRNIMRVAEFMRRSFKLSRESISITWLPIFHDNGLIDGICDPIYTGYKGIFLSPITFIQRPFRWLKAITKYGGTHSGAPNFAFDHCVDGISDEEKIQLDLSSLKTMYSGAEPVRKSTLDRFISSFKDRGFKAHTLCPSYGMAETTLIIAGPPALRGYVSLSVAGSALEKNKIILLPENEADARFLVGIGFPWIDTKVRIVNPETLLPCKDDEVGEIWVNGSIVTAGYWDKPEITEKTYSAQIQDEPGLKYLRTGDLGFFHQGELYITGRLKDMIIIRGSNYYPQDIEFVAEASHTALRANASAAFSVEVNNEEKLVIVVEVERTAIKDLNVDEVCDAIRQQVSEEFELEVYGIQLIRTASILKTSSGKIQRKACKEGFLDKSLQKVGESILEVSTSTDAHPVKAIDLPSLQAWLMAWLHIHLKIPFEKIDASKPISVYGLNSMKAVQLQQDVLDKYGVNMPPYLFFDKSTLKELSEKALELMQESE